MTDPIREALEGELQHAGSRGISGEHQIIAAPQGVSNSLAVPDYMQDLETGFDDFDDYIKPTRLALLMGTSPAEAKALGQEGLIHTTPGLQVVWKPGDIPVTFIPLFIWTEFICWNPRGVKGLPAMRDRTFDRTTVLAQRCRSRNLKDREFVCPEAPTTPGKPPKMCKYQEHINVLITLVDHQMQGEPMMLSFSRSAFKAGVSFCNVINGRVTPMVGQLFTLKASGRSNDEGDWQGFDIASLVHHESNLVAIASPEWTAYANSQRQHIKHKFAQNMLVAQYSDEEQRQNNGPSEAEIIEGQKQF